jgi:hypothetical protein
MYFRATSLAGNVLAFTEGIAQGLKGASAPFSVENGEWSPDVELSTSPTEDALSVFGPPQSPIGTGRIVDRLSRDRLSRACLAHPGMPRHSE